MKIVDVKTWPVRGIKYNWTLLKIITDEGLTGVGERHYTRFGIRDLLEKHVCDVTRCGGPSEMKRMAAMAEAYNVLIAPHSPNGPLSTLASAHVCAAIPNFFRQEFMFNDVPWRDTVIDHPIAGMISGGCLHLSDRPGLGVDLVELEKPDLAE
jgi:galactonate dehydratase